MGGNVNAFTDANFDDQVVKAGELTLVDFWAEWCAPCRMIAPIVEELSTEYAGKVKVGKLNVDENPQTATKYGIRGIPTLLFFKNGEVLGQVVGVRSKNELQTIINNHLGN